MIAIEINDSKIVYIASPFAGDVNKNTEFAKAACLYAIKCGNTPVASHLMYPQMLDDDVPSEREIGLKMGLRIIDTCDELWLCGDETSSGMAAEKEYAQAKGVPVRNISSDEILAEKEFNPAWVENKSAAPQQSEMQML